MFFYVVGAILTCYIFRKHCQDPALELEDEEEEERFTHL
jgi:hypothetical protein